MRRIFEFYLSANEILRDDERRWFGFEVQEVLVRGERILQSMNGAPPLVHFTLGALYHKIGDYKSAVNHLSYVVENENSDESTYHLSDTGTPRIRENSAKDRTRTGGSSADFRRRSRTRTRPPQSRKNASGRKPPPAARIRTGKTSANLRTKTP